MHFFSFVLLLGLGHSLITEASMPARFRYPTDAGELLRPEYQKDFVRQVRRFRFNAAKPMAVCSLIIVSDGPASADTIIHIDPQRLLNHSEAATVFYHWFLEDRDVPFIEILEEQHRVACEGATGRREYNYFDDRKGHRGYSSLTARPGKLRRTLHQEERERGDHFPLDDANLDLLKSLGQPWAVDYRVGGKRVETRIQVRGVPLNHSPLFVVEEDGWVTWKAPVGTSELSYEPIATELIHSLKAQREKTHDEILEKLDPFLDEIADTYHTILNWSAFYGVTKPLPLGELNVLLRHFGFSSVPQWELDHLGYVSDYLVFRKIFKKHFMKENRIAPQGYVFRDFPERILLLN